jgi:predicted dehydrogenase
MKKLRWGVIGAGGIADRRTLPGMMKAGNARLHAVMEIDPAFAETLRAKYGAAKAYDSWEALLDDPEVDAVYIASPVFLHAEQAIRAAEQGKHILIEKPIALTSTQGQEVLDACERNQVLIAAGLMMRFGTHINRMKEAVEQEKIGDLVSCFSHFTCWFPDMAGNWRQDPATSGGGALMDMGIHCIDLIRYVTGSRIREVAAFCDTLTFDYKVEDSAMVMLKLENGALCTVQANFNIPDQASKWRFELFGTRGRLVGDNVIGQIDGGELDALFVEDAGAYDAQQDKQTGTGQKLETAQFGDMYTREIESFGNSVLHGLPLVVPASEALQAQQVVEAAYLSNQERTIISL